MAEERWKKYMALAGLSPPTKPPTRGEPFALPPPSPLAPPLPTEEPKLSLLERIFRFSPYTMSGSSAYQSEKEWEAISPEAKAASEELYKRFPTGMELDYKEAESELLAKYPELEAKARLTPSPEEYREYRALPWLQQMKYEIPAMAVAGVLFFPAIGTIPIKGVEISVWEARAMSWALRKAYQGISAIKGKIKLAQLKRLWEKTEFYKKYGEAIKTYSPELGEDLFSTYRIFAQKTPESLRTAEGLMNRILASLRAWRYGKGPTAPPEVPVRGFIPAWIGGLPADQRALLPMTAAKWAKLPIPQKVDLIKVLGLSGQVASKAWGALSEAEKAVLMAKPEITPEIAPEAARPPAEVVAPPAEVKSVTPLEAPEVPTRPVTEPPVKPDVLMATNAQKAEAHIIAKEKALVDLKTGKPREQYKKLAKIHTGKRSMADMTTEEADSFIEALGRYPEKKWSPKAGDWIPQAIPKTKAIVPENYFNLEFGEPTPVRLFTSQNYYATKLGVGEFTQPLELAKQELDLVSSAWSRAVELKIGELNKIYKVTLKEKLAAKAKNRPTRASAEMAQLLNKYEDLPADLVDKLGMEKVKIFVWFRNLNRTLLNAQNQIREILNMPLIPHRQAYFRHIANQTIDEVWRGNFSLPQDLAIGRGNLLGKRFIIQWKCPERCRTIYWNTLAKIWVMLPNQCFGLL